MLRAITDQLGHPARCSSRATPSSRRPGSSATTIRPGCCARTTAPRTSCPARSSRRCSAAGSSTSRSSTGPRRTRSTCCSTAMAEREVKVPRVGHDHGGCRTFRVLASMNPFDNVGTARISSSSTTGCAASPSATRTAAEDERSSRCAPAATTTGSSPTRVALTRATRAHPDVRQREQRARAPSTSSRSPLELAALRELRHRRRAIAPRVVLDAALLALSARIGVDEASEATPEEVITADLGGPFLLGAPACGAGTPPVRVAEPDSAAGPGRRRRRGLAPAAAAAEAARPRHPRCSSRATGAPLVVDVTVGRPRRAGAAGRPRAARASLAHRPARRAA